MIETCENLRLNPYPKKGLIGSLKDLVRKLISESFAMSIHKTKLVVLQPHEPESVKILRSLSISIV